jgi:hypothetical protein
MFNRACGRRAVHSHIHSPGLCFEHRSRGDRGPQPGTSDAKFSPDPAFAAVQPIPEPKKPLPELLNRRQIKDFVTKNRIILVGTPKWLSDIGAF